MVTGEEVVHTSDRTKKVQDRVLQGILFGGTSIRVAKGGIVVEGSPIKAVNDIHREGI